MKSQLLKAEMKSMKKQSQKVQYLYHQDCEGDQRKLNLVILPVFLSYGYSYGTNR